MMNKLLGISLVAAGSVLATLASVGSAQAASYTLGSSWVTPSWGGNPPVTLTPDYTFTIDPGNVGTLDVTDWQNVGDVYSVYNGATLIGSTNFVALDPAHPIAATPDAGWADPAFSKGTFSLAPGAYDISLLLTSGYGGGLGALRASEAPARPVPVPAVVPGVILAALYFGKKTIQRKQTLTTMI